MSDLHMEMREYSTDIFSGLDADLVILAGDIGEGTLGITWAQKSFKCPVLYVAGNHEYFGHDFELLIPAMRKACEGSNVTFLENDSIVIDEVRYVGATLWTDFCINGSNGKMRAIEYARQKMADYQFIRNGDEILDPLHTISRHEVSKDYLAKELASSSGPIVIITHHGPSPSTVPPKYSGGTLTPAFTSNLDALFQPPLVAWIYGHNHDSKIWAVKNVPLISNQWGYPLESSSHFAKTITLGSVLEKIRRYREGM